MTLFLTLKLFLAEIIKVVPSNLLILWPHSLSTVILESPKIKSVTVMKLKDIDPCKESYHKPRQHIKKQRHHFSDKGSHTRSCAFSSSHVQM